MNIAELSIRYKVITTVMTVLVVVGGAVSYINLGRLEDPEFTLKEAQVFTKYPGATATEVAEEVTDKIETAIQKLGQLKRVHSISEAGKSTIRVVIKDNYDKDSLPQVWDELRRKVNDVRPDLPPGASEPIVYDDFGQVYGVFYAVYGDGFSYAELKEVAKKLRRELLLVQDVRDVEFFGIQDEVVYVELARAKLAQLGVSPEAVYTSLAGQNLVADSGKADVGPYEFRIQPTGEFTSVAQIGDLLILQDDATDTKLYLKDFANIRRGYVDPPGPIMHFNGMSAIGLGISTVEGGNVVTMGEALSKRINELTAEMPIGVEVGVIAHQANAVTASINNFVVSLVEALIIVVGVLMIAMGLRSGLLIGFILLLTVLGTLVVMDIQGIMLERISLGALIIALGMLVDNAIVITDGILVRIKDGMDRIEAASSIVSQTIWPLFGATIVGVLAFAAIGASQDSTGEYCRSLYQVILISLTLSWLVAITVTPLLGITFLKAPKTEETQTDPYAHGFYRKYKKMLCTCIKYRRFTIIILLGLMAISVYGFGFVERSFFPNSTRPQFMVHFWLPQGTRLVETESQIENIEKHVLTIDEVTNVSSFIGQGSLRFLLTYQPEEANNAYAMMLVGVTDYKNIDQARAAVKEYIDANFADAQSFSRRFVLGPGDPAKIHARFRGYDPDMLRILAAETKKIMHAEPTATDILDDWRQRVALIRPLVSETQARNAGITRAGVARALHRAYDGIEIGIYREKDELLPIIARSPQVEYSDVDNLNYVQIYSPVAQKAIPISQVVLGFETQSENSIVRRRHRLPTLTVKCDPVYGKQATDVFEKLRPRIEAMFAEMTQKHNLVGYTLEWGGEYEDSRDAQAGLKSRLGPIALLMMLTVIFLFNSIRKPLVIFLTVPLAIVGVTIGLLMFSQPFGFMALLGFMSLSGIIILNSLVLIDEINAQLAKGKQPLDAVVDAGVSRLRPVSMTAITTVLGMIPLLGDAFFIAMAVTIMFGLTFATVLTLVVVPVLYTCFFKIPYSESG